MPAFIHVRIFELPLLNYFFGAFTSLFSVVNPLGMMPVFLALTSGHPTEYRSLMARKASIYVICILSFFLVAGSYLMSFFGFSLISLRIAGGLIVMRSGFHLLNGTDKSVNLSDQGAQEAKIKADISLTPLALPLLSGPGSIATVISLSTHTNGFGMRTLLIFLAILAIGIISYLILRISQTLLPVLGRAGLEAVTKIMGFIAMTVGVQFIVTGIELLLQEIS